MNKIKMKLLEMSKELLQLLTVHYILNLIIGG